MIGRTGRDAQLPVRDPAHLGLVVDRLPGKDHPHGRHVGLGHADRGVVDLEDQVGPGRDPPGDAGGKIGRILAREIAGRRHASLAARPALLFGSWSST